MERFFQYLFDGLSVGSIYALLALGLVVVFRGTGALNFAQGEMAMFSAFVVWQFHDWGIPLWIATILGMVFGFASGALTEVLLIRPVGKKSPIAVFVVSIALFLGINSLASMIWGALPAEGMPNLFPSEPDDFVRIFGAVWRYKSIGVLVVALLLCGALFALFGKTRFGLAMRAVASNPESSRLVGISTGMVLMASWGIAGGMGALSGTLVAGNNGEVTSGLMFTVFIYASAAATLGGLDSPGGAVIAGLSIGVVENMAAGYFPIWIGQEMKLAVALVIIFVVLLVRPSGLFGSQRIERV
ncbi:MAG: branched-chain amino acid ABC transporter permease [Ilumatobacteraceae bacterium]|nr:MAG: branched-chain amino acid ABC transporter permease [Actinomycetota bacterium]